ncbi:MAG: hypothetical protein KAY16_08065 [Spirochaetes bacterium]|nr:hypothetical protein [Spirochaetota bacterium]
MIQVDTITIHGNTIMKNLFLNDKILHLVQNEIPMHQQDSLHRLYIAQARLL